MFTTPPIKGIKDNELSPAQYIALLAIHAEQTDPERRFGIDGAFGEIGNAIAGGQYKKDAISEENNQHGIHTLIALMHTLLKLGADPRLMGLHTRVRQSERIDYSNISKYLHLAEFTPDHVILLDKAPSQTLAMHYAADDLVGLLCWLVLDIKMFLSSVYVDDLPSEVEYLAQAFAERYLTSDQQLLSNQDPDEPKVLVEQLLHVFYEIMRFHPPIDTQTQDVADAIEAYLTHTKTRQALAEKENGRVEAYLGSEMYDVWEMLCLDNFLQKELDDNWKVLIVDAGNLPKHLEDKLELQTLALKDNPNFDTSHQKLYFDGKLPDLVLYQFENDMVTYRIIDFKYYDYGRLLSDKQKGFKEQKGDAFDFYFNESKNDIQKSQSYAFGVQRFHMAEHPEKQIRISLEFWVAADNQQTEPIEVFNPYQCLVPKPINDMIKKTLEHKAFTL